MTETLSEPRTCSVCGELQTVYEVIVRKTTNKTYHTLRKECWGCTRARRKANYWEDVEQSRADNRQLQKARYRANPAKAAWASALERARKAGIPFDITVEDIVIPEHCPVLGIPLQTNEGLARDNSPSLDKIVPERGYVKGNIIVISNRANRIKYDATVDELQKVANYYAALAAP